MSEPIGGEKRRFPRTAADEFAYGIYKGKLSIEERDVTVGVNVVTLMYNRPERTGWIAVNHSATDIYLSFREDTTAGRGLILPPNGGTVSFSLMDDGMVTGWQMYAIASAGGLLVSVFETYRYAMRRGG